MPPLTVHLAVKNNEDSIEEALASVAPLEAEVLIADLGCRDGTLAKCAGCRVVPVSLNDNMAQVRNYLLSQSTTDWNLYIHPWERVMHGIESILPALRGSARAYRLNVLQGDVMTRQIRLWHKSSGLVFSNPVFEALVGEAEGLPVYLAAGVANDVELQAMLLEKWQQNAPLVNEINYYAACLHLGRKNWQSFLNTADHYIYREKKETMPVIMTRYYCAMVQCYMEKNSKKAINYLLPCLAQRPLMAEFWCLLGDIYYAGRQYDKAKCFYENALILGAGRPQDEWPLEISKYDDYPKKMIAACDSLTQSLRLYKGKAAPSPQSSS